jgi:spore coat protein U-like protein
MTGPSSSLLAYGLYQNSNHSTNWGNTTNLVSHTGTGSAILDTVYGEIAAGTAASTLGSYSDTITVTVTY